MPERLNIAEEKYKEINNNHSKNTDRDSLYNVKNNVKFVDQRRKEMINTDELHFERFEKFSMKKISNMSKLAVNANTHCDSANLRYRSDIKMLSMDFS